MTELLGFHFYRTENLSINGIDYTVRFAQKNDSLEFALFVSNNSNGKERKYHFTKEVADDFKTYHGESLEKEVLKTIENDVQNGLI